MRSERQTKKELERRLEGKTRRRLTAKVTRAIVPFAFGLLLGSGLLVEGVLVFLSGIGQPGVGPFLTARGVVGGNLPLVVGLLLMIAGLAVLSGIISFEVRKWTGADDQ
jgi:hypothetical protein